MRNLRKKIFFTVIIMIIGYIFYMSSFNYAERYYLYHLSSFTNAIKYMEVICKIIDNNDNVSLPHYTSIRGMDSTGLAVIPDSLIVKLNNSLNNTEIHYITVVKDSRCGCIIDLQLSGALIYHYNRSGGCYINKKVLREHFYYYYDDDWL